FRRINIQRGIVLHQTIQQEVLVKMAQSRELSRNRPVAYSVAEQLAEECAYIFSPGLEQFATLRLKELCKLNQVGSVGRCCQRREPFFHPQIIQEILQNALVSRLHNASMCRTAMKVNNVWGSLLAKNCG